MNNRIALMLGMVLALATAVMASIMPASSESTAESNYQAKLRAMGVPEGAEIVAMRGDDHGNLHDIYYRDSDGNIQLVAPLPVPKETPRPGK
jgi:Fe2+ transport system protein FeoA